jgi:hypothetical protein
MTGLSFNGSQSLCVFIYIYIYIYIYIMSFLCFHYYFYKLLFYIYISTQRIRSDLSIGVKRPGRKADHSLPSGSEVKECVELYLHFPIRLHGVVLS